MIYKLTICCSFYIFLIISGCLVALCFFVLNIKRLMVAYMYLGTVLIVFMSYWTNQSMVKAMLAEQTFEPLTLYNLTQHPYVIILLPNFLVQVFAAFLFLNIHVGPRHPYLQNCLVVSFTGPSILALLPVPTYILEHAPLFASLAPLAVVKFVLWASILSIIGTVNDGFLYVRNFTSNFGLSALIEAEWVRLRVPEVLRTFWLIRLLQHAFNYYMSGEVNTIEATDIGLTYHLIKELMVKGSDTLTAVLGITSIVSYICHHIGRFFQWVLLTEDDNDKSIGTVSAILFYILALQTGLTGLEPDKRFVRLCRNFCLLFTALLHFIHNIVSPLLMSLSASHNPSLKRHVRALAVCAFLVIFPLCLLFYLWSYNSASTWLLAVSAFSIEVIVKVAVSICIYTLFLLDARRETFWEKLDDYVYYIRAFGNTVEFCFGIFLFFNGAWILVFESGGAIRAVMMCIHAYFNIWCDACAGWSVFIKRRTAVNKIESLPEANPNQLQLLNDVCAICFQEMRSAKITTCKHFFHGVCLRKWLYVQDRCPLCHNILHNIDCENTNEREANPLHEGDAVHYNR